MVAPCAASDREAGASGCQPDTASSTRNPATYASATCRQARQRDPKRVTVEQRDAQGEEDEIERDPSESHACLIGCTCHVVLMQIMRRALANCPNGLLWRATPLLLHA